MGLACLQSGERAFLRFPARLAGNSVCGAAGAALLWAADRDPVSSMFLSFSLDQQLPRTVLIENKRPNYRRTFKVFAHTISTSIPLAKASHMPSPTSMEGKPSDLCSGRHCRATCFPRCAEIEKNHTQIYWTITEYSFTIDGATDTKNFSARQFGSIKMSNVPIL